MKKAFILSTCDTCSRILKELNLDSSWTIIDIKKDPISEADLNFAAELNGGYESCFNKRARKYTEQNIKDTNPTEADYKKLILEEYTFLKRPVFIWDEQVWVGNSKTTIADLKTAMNEKG
ncbi:MAG: arsenate reductase [Sphingobacteriales bacterium]